MNTPEKTVPSRTYRIAVLPGDGIGKEVMPEGLFAGHQLRAEEHLQ